MRRNALSIVLTIVIICACDGADMNTGDKQLSSIVDVSMGNWQKLKEKRIFFGHQSVGNNIIGGLERMANEHPKVKLNVIESKNPEDFQNPAFYHSKIGKNADPLSKNNDFSLLLNNGIGQKVDIAFYKYCYIDVKKGTDVDSLFLSYKENIEKLKKQLPHVKFVHVTVPLVVVQSGPWAWVKKIIGRKIGGYDDNMQRNVFNAMITNEYNGRDPIFDLAKIESTYPDGRRMTFEYKGRIYSSLVADHASDGRHLNERGSNFVAEQLLVLLAELPD